MRITGKTRVLGIIGSPVGHSLSPAMHNEAIAALGIDYIYVPFPVEPLHLGVAVEGLRRLGVWGFNVTIPHKSDVIPFLDGVSREAELCGAVNTVRREGDLLIGHNTDGAGFLASLREDLGFDPAGKSILILGAGGAARGAVAALAEAGVAGISVANRTAGKGSALVERFRPLFGRVRFGLSSLRSGELEEHLRGADLLVNTTSVGMNGTKFDDMPLSGMRSGGMVYDMVYVPSETPLLASARRMGLACANGLGMLASQGEAAFTLWTGMAPPANLMKITLQGELEG